MPIARLRENSRLAPEEREILGTAAVFLGKLISITQRLQKARPQRDLPSTKAEFLHDIIVSLGQIQGRLQSETLEL